jgi:predicted DNA-binding transcriptional regulator AlpA
MNETHNKKITVDVKELADMLSIGRNTALRIGEEAGAKIRIGRRVVYSVAKIQEYIDERLEG